MPSLQEVFGVNTQVRTLSYVDRGLLDERLAYLLKTDRHISIHGDTKQGKSWLRRRMLDDSAALAVQCNLDSTYGSIFRDALGLLGVHAPAKRAEGTERGGSMSATAGGRGGLPFLAEARAEGTVEGTVSTDHSEESEPVGQTADDLAWVAQTLRVSGKRLVIEDFHYVSEHNRREVAFRLKALLDYGVPVIVVGIWPAEMDLLAYYDGDLDGRVENIYLAWKPEELHAVLDRGGGALNVGLAEDVATQMVSDSVGNVGLLQRLAEQLCLSEGVREAQSKKREIGSRDSLEAARTAVTASMRGRFGAFADNFVRGMRRLSSGLEVYRHLLQAFTAATDDELLEGIDSADLLNRINASNEREVRLSDLTQALERVGRLQAKISVNPPVLSYSPDARRLFLVDRAFLFYRRYGNPIWPWDRENLDLSTSPGQETLNLDD